MDLVGTGRRGWEGDERRRLEGGFIGLRPCRAESWGRAPGWNEALRGTGPGVAVWRSEEGSGCKEKGIRLSVAAHSGHAWLQRVSDSSLRVCPVLNLLRL
jgi:hypothetical protein